MCVCVSFAQALREEKQSYEKEMMNMRAKYEEDAAHFKESQSRALEEISKKHRATLESTQSASEKDKNRLLAVSVHKYYCPENIPVCTLYSKHEYAVLCCNIPIISM